MESTSLRLGFLGWGEVAHRFAKDLSQAGLTDMTAYSRSAARAAPDDPRRARAAEAGVEIVDSPRTLCRRANVILAVTPGKSALAAARSVRAHLNETHVYVDASAVAVKTMEQVNELIGKTAAFVDASIMGSVPLGGIKVLTVASGPQAGRFRDALAPYGMNIQVIGEKVGAASAMKLIRSICMKGLAVLLIETLEAAERYGVRDFVAADMAGSIDERPFADYMKRLVCGTAVHAERRVHEMTDIMALLRDLGSSDRMSRATRAALKSVADMGLRERFGGQEPKSMAEVIEAVVEKRAATQPPSAE